MSETRAEQPQLFDQLVALSSRPSLSDSLPPHDFTKCIPILTRMYMNVYVSRTKHQLYKILQPYHMTAICLEYASLDWESIENAIRNEINIRSKMMDKQTKDLISFTKFSEGSLAHSLGEQIISGFENGNFERRARILLSELCCLVQYYGLVKRKSNGESEIYADSLLLLSNDLYLREVDYIISIAFYQMPSLFDLEHLINVFLMKPHAKDHITSLVLNNPNIIKRVSTIKCHICFSAYLLTGNNVIRSPSS
jgi:hypothetical protein